MHKESLKIRFLVPAKNFNAIRTASLQMYGAHAVLSAFEVSLVELCRGEGI